MTGSRRSKLGGCLFGAGVFVAYWSLFLAMLAGGMYENPNNSPAKQNEVVIFLVSAAVGVGAAICGWRLARRRPMRPF
jgi:hypothetical protein